MQENLVLNNEEITENNHMEAMYQSSISIVDSKSFTYNHSDKISDDTFKMGFGQKYRASDAINAGFLSIPGYCFFPDEKAESIYDTVKNNPSITEFTIIENNIAIGFLTRTAFNEKLGGKYGFSLFSQNAIREIMKTDFLSVDYYMPVEQVSKLSMQRQFDQLYDPIVVEKEGNYYGIVTIKDLLDTCTRMALYERDEIALMRDNLKIGIFFMDRDFIIQNQYSRYLEDLFSQDSLNGKSFIELISSSVTEKELEAIKDYFNMIFENTYDQSLLEEINPLMELQYAGNDQLNKKVLQCGFAAIKRNSRESFVLVSVYDITAKVELQRQLAEEENKRQEELKTLFELLQVEPMVFNDFYDDMEHEFNRIQKTLMSDTVPEHEKLVNIYQSLHAVKSNAFILEQNTFGNKLHKLESKIKKLNEQKEINFQNMLNLTLEIESLIHEKEKFKKTIERFNSYRSNRGEEKICQAQEVLVTSLSKTVGKVSADTGKKVKFSVEKIDEEAINKGPRRVIKEALIQLIRNSIVHGIEMPEDRNAAGKKKTGLINLSIKMKDDKIHIKLSDNGRGLDYDKIAEKAIQLKLVKPEDKKDKKMLLKAIFCPSFSTAEKESIHGGRGIGLNLVYNLVYDIKGSIKVQTEHGKGTVFHIFLPVNR